MLDHQLAANWPRLKCWKQGNAAAAGATAAVLAVLLGYAICCSNPLERYEGVAGVEAEPRQRRTDGRRRQWRWDGCSTEAASVLENLSENPNQDLPEMMTTAAAGKTNQELAFL